MSCICSAWAASPDCKEHFPHIVSVEDLRFLAEDLRDRSRWMLSSSYETSEGDQAVASALDQVAGAIELLIEKKGKE